MKSSKKIIKFVILLISVFVTCETNSLKSLRENKSPFRIGRINDIWSKAVQIINGDKDLLELYGELSLQDLHLIRLKHQGISAENDVEYEYGHKKHLDLKLVDILKQHHLDDLYEDEMQHLKDRYNKKNNNKKNTNNNNQIQIINKNTNNDNMRDNRNEKDNLSDMKFEKSLKKSARVHALWLKAHVAGFSDEELASLKMKLQAYLDKLHEYDREMVQVEEQEEGLKNNNTPQKHSVGNKRLKEMHKELHKTVLTLEVEVRGRVREGGGDHRVGELWGAVNNLDLSHDQMQEIKKELDEFSKRIEKHDHYFKEAEKMKVLGSSSSSDGEEKLKKVNEKVKLHATKIKSWHSDLKRKLYGKIEHTDL